MPVVRPHEPAGLGPKLLRILIASYFIAVALRMIPGTNFTNLANQIADPQVANVLSAVVVFSLAYMVMIGYWTRAAALILGLLTFFSAFVSYVGPEGGGDLAAFWRDIALVAALMLTYSPPRDRANTAAETRATRLRKARGRLAAATSMTTQRVPHAPQPVARIADLNIARERRMTTRPFDLRAPLASDEIETLFHDFPDRASR